MLSRVPTWTIALAWSLSAATALVAQSSDLVDLRRIGHVTSKGRIQDQGVPVVEALIKAGPAATTFLISKLDDSTPIRGQVFDFWPTVEVRQVALVILCDLFTAPDGVTPTVSGVSWDEILERQSNDVPAWTLYDDYIARHGRTAVRAKVERLLAPSRDHLVWNTRDRCFRLRD